LKKQTFFNDEIFHLNVNPLIHNNFLLNPYICSRIIKLKIKRMKTAEIVTEKGTMKVEFYEKDAPGTVKNFCDLAKKGFYDGLTFHRVIEGFMIQGGDPKADGSGDPGFSIKDEPNNLKHDSAGVLAMARTPFPDSAGSQFYITLAPQPRLDQGAAVPNQPGRFVPYVVFGKVTEGLDVVMKIGGVQTNSADKPLSPVTIKKITIERAK